MSKDKELKQLRQENHVLQAANQNLRICVLESMQAIDALHKQVKEQQEVITLQQERLKTLEGQLAKDSHNSGLPPPQIGLCVSPRVCGKRAARNQEDKKAIVGITCGR
jgi:uncharacterized coiled-coil protein SlyX